MFLLAWFHAVVQERRNFVPQGWSKFYEFSFADLRSGADIIDLTTRNGRAPQWKYIVGLLENAIYGGRVDNPYDIQVMRTYLHQFFSADVRIRTRVLSALAFSAFRDARVLESHPKGCWFKGTCKGSKWHGPSWQRAIFD